MRRNEIPHATSDRDPCEYFAAHGRASFDFLVSEHGFAPAVASSHPRECSVLYRRGDDRSLYIHGDIGHVASVMLGLVNTSVRMGFHELISVSDPARWGRRPARDPGFIPDTQFCAWLDYYRDYLLDHLDTLLGGRIETPLGENFAGLPDDLRALVIAVSTDRASRKQSAIPSHRSSGRTF